MIQSLHNTEMSEVNKKDTAVSSLEWRSILRDVSNTAFLEMSNFLPEEMDPSKGHILLV